MTVLAIQTTLHADPIIAIADVNRLHHAIAAGIEVDTVRIPDSVHRGEDPEVVDVDVFRVGGRNRPEC